MIHDPVTLQVFKRHGQSMVLVETDFQKMARTKAVLSVLIVDRSGSMQEFEKLPEELVNKHIDNLKLETGAEQYVMVITFADTPSIDINLSHCKSAPKLDNYKANGCTLLYDTVYYTLKSLYHIRNRIPRALLGNLKIVIGVFSDGENNPPEAFVDRDQPRKLQEACRRVLETGKFDLNSYGIGIDAGNLARKMGFPTDADHCITVERSRAGVTRATDTFTQRTSTFSMEFDVD
ncbi:hypothetical protein COT97_05255 [Candidatus Falkowbacteria bacterium CG10_big_fil_rev_8_21_14_0_10_39_11]|uniref:Uncharacterized protein n=1 Tax=Candidatus Falkowbacteria bacterium CG10_big_fil_rev_8_21_14_0_10_39_11 TaxID=1974565 RepID=A0A2H0V5M8_9BACT|nr:MAG: hypothetical protein COT97_05255 [Candidatus Falkowbacteria bacterium CG10_big_fil_rev_8_21_14_0_10_39_11]